MHVEEYRDKLIKAFHDSGHDELITFVPVADDNEINSLRDLLTLCRFPVRARGKWIVTNQDSDGIHEIECPICKCIKGGDFRPYITVTFDSLPLFCDSCGADLRGEHERNNI